MKITRKVYWKVVRVRDGRIISITDNRELATSISNGIDMYDTYVDRAGVG